MAQARRAYVDSPQGRGHNQERGWGITLAEGVMTLFPGDLLSSPCSLDLPAAFSRSWPGYATSFP